MANGHLKAYLWKRRRAHFHRYGATGVTAEAAIRKPRPHVGNTSVSSPTKEDCPSVQVQATNWPRARTDKLDIRTAAGMARRAARLEGALLQLVLDSGTSLTLRRLQVLFHSLSKVLFIFRSRYLCAIGLPKIFSLGRGIPAIRTAFPSSTTPKVSRCCFAQRWENGAITL